MKVSPSDEHDNHQDTGSVYKEPVQSAMLRSSSLPLTAASRTRPPKNVRNENSDSSSHKDEETPNTTSNENEDAGFSDFIANVGAVDNTKNNQWQCSKCSYINKNPLRLTCDICGTARVGQESGAEMAARHESMEQTVEMKPDIIEDDDDSPPLPPWQIGCENEDLATKKSYVTSSAPPPTSDCQPSTTSDVVDPPSTSDEDIEQNTLNRGQPQIEIVIHRPPPPSMLRSQSNDEEEEPSVDLPSFPILEATLVEEPPVYDAIAVRSDANQGESGAQENGDKANIDQHAISWWKRNQKYLLVGVIALVFGGLIATVATLVGSKDDINIVVPDILQPSVPINDTPYNTTTSVTDPSATNTTTFTTTTSTTVS